MPTPTALSQGPRAIALLRLIEFAEGETCSAFCPNLANKPASEGCGTVVCMEQQVPKIAREALKGLK